ncbi:hypothetical protein H072_6939 [Dactylellina haptotyla CBS 200.50]|uniref:Uncharacterized protein n=1 Tax=Dactylellina haptotyla (strain CBS 200.50) TaxID=1284197 RepID=S8BVN0_DACHA|nr:hypothetical protein H072_6939 [Dactylellina haptotyla CBS 200.50]
MVSAADLTKPITISTKIPAPPDDSFVKWTKSEEASSNSPTIEIVACSELVEYAAAVDTFSSGGKLKVVQDFRQHQIIFSINKDGKLNCLTHAPGESQGWELHDISPSGGNVITFDVAVTKVNHKASGLEAGVFLTAATPGANGYSVVHTAFIKIPDFVTDKIRGPIKWNDLSWVIVPDPVGEKVVTTLFIGMVKNREGSKSTRIVFAGSKQQGSYAATYFAIDPTPGIQDPWTPFSPDNDADAVTDIVPASIKGQDDGAMNTLAGSLGKFQGVCASVNPWNFTDWVFACEQGVGFVDHRYPKQEPQPVLGLPKIGFRQVVCSEAINPENTGETCITIFAVSDDNELYYIEGSRKWNHPSGAISLTSSGLPIRRNVVRISCQFNTDMNSSELIYTSSHANEVKHLLRDPKTTCWSESTITFTATNVLQSFKAYLTTISINCSDGRSIGNNFPVSIKSESMMVLINDYSHSLSARGTQVYTNEQGKIALVARAPDTLKSPTYTIEVSREGVSHTATIEAGQRVIEVLSKYDTAEKLMNAKSTDGQPVFDKASLESQKEGFEQSANLLRSFPSMVGSLQSSGTTGDVSANAEVIVENGTISTADSSLWAEQNFGSKVIKFFGDAIEWMRDAAKNAFKAVFSVVAQGIKLVLTMAGKAFIFVIESVGSLVGAIGSYLKERFGLDFKKYFKWLGLVFDPDKTKKLQKLIESSIKGVLSLPGELTKGSKNELEDVFQSLEAGLKPYLGDKTPAKIPAPEDPRSLLKKTPLGLLMNHPVFTILSKLNPMAIITESWDETSSETLNDTIKIPNMMTYIQQAALSLENAFHEQKDFFLKLLDDIFGNIKDVISDPSAVLDKLKGTFQDVFYYIFGAVKKLIMVGWQFFGDIIDAVLSYIQEIWKIPIFTQWFEWYAEQDFTILNVLTFYAARVGELLFGEDKVTSFFSSGETLSAMSEIAKTGQAFGKDTSMDKIDARGPEFSIPEKISPSQLIPSKSGAAFPSISLEKIRTIAPDSKTAHTNESHESNGTHKTVLSPEGKATIHDYEARAKWITAAVGVSRCIAVILEAVHLVRQDGAGAGHGGQHTGSLNNIAAVANILSFTGSICQLLVYQHYRNHSNEVRRYLDEYQTAMSVGAVGGVLGNGIAMFFGVIHAIKAHKQVEGYTGDCAVISTVFLSAATFTEVISLHMIPNFLDGHEALATTGQFFELIATAFGIASISFARNKDSKSATVASMFDGFFSLSACGTVILNVHLM